LEAFRTPMVRGSACRPASTAWSNEGKLFPPANDSAASVLRQGASSAIIATHVITQDW